MSRTLPVDDALPALRDALNRTTNVVLEAPPGAGKTTRVPLALLHEAWSVGKKIVMLEPRRLAARSAAAFMARQLGESVGGTVGYRVRGDTRVSAQTRIEVVTEGVLARLLSADAALDDVALVIFDEFHERSLHADLGLALVLQTQSVLRPDLRVLVMSATIDGDAVASLLRDDTGAPAPVVRSEGRMFPVATEYRPPRGDERIEATVARAVVEAVQAHEGDVLVFLRGAGEQRRVAERIEGHEVLRSARCVVHQLHGAMPLAQQDAAIAAGPAGERKVVLATSIAETSLTIEGVRVVIDCGLSRIPRYSARAGITRLETVRVSRASADQRRGRAGRVAPGVCYRLWDAHADATLVPRTRPEILEADLAPFALALADAGVRDPGELLWLDAPPSGAFAGALGLLRQLDAIDGEGRITAHGRDLASLPVHPRFAHLLVKARARGAEQLGAELCALAEERDVLRGEYGPPQSDLRLRLELVRGVSASVLGASLAGAHVDHDALRRVRQTASDLRSRSESSRKQHTRRRAENSGNGGVGGVNDADSVDFAASLMALAYPDRVAQHRSGSDPRFVLRSGVGAALLKSDALAAAPFLSIVDLDGSPPEYRIARAIPLERDEVFAAFGDQIERADVVEWDSEARAVRTKRRVQLGSIVLDEHQVSAPDANAVLEVLLREIQRMGVDALPWTDGAERMRTRMNFLHRHQSLRGETWPDVSADALGSSLADWLGPSLEGVRRWDDVAKVDLGEALRGLLSWEQRAALDRLAPTHLDVPSGSRIAIDYSDPAAPVLAVKLQEVFGWTSTPMLLDGKIPVTLHLLSPAQRPVQVTRDLAGFWRNSYFDVRKDLRGRYPRHPWPDDPLTAPATRRAKPRGT
ncbi:MAG: ATP-dependent helicase HrpB [Gemmatimonas sp.]